ncbi:hypothetical protein [Photobacterium aquae]|nr:hypothetical protein [Photobacterium aquae]
MYDNTIRAIAETVPLSFGEGTPGIVPTANLTERNSCGKKEKAN